MIFLSRPKERKIETDPELHERVTGDLKKGWSADTWTVPAGTPARKVAGAEGVS
jgi:hypothetical protein